MTLEPVECPLCGGTNVIKHGKSGEGKQRYLCQDQACCRKTFIRDYSELARLPEVKEQIIEDYKEQEQTWQNTEKDYLSRIEELKANRELPEDYEDLISERDEAIREKRTLEQEILASWARQRHSFR